MTKTRFTLLIFLLSPFFTFSQFQVKGVVKNDKKEPIAGASITVKDSYYGASSDSNGVYEFSIPDTGKITLVVTMLGYKPFEKEMTISNPSTIADVMMKDEISEMKAVVITAGSFEAGDKKRTTVLKSIDVVTIAGQQAELTAAIKTLPGTQQIGEQEGLFVRGGTGAETKIFIDGLTVNNPFYSSVPDVAQRSRFSPLIFKGTVFSSGGYSAQYGQALSSALVLETLDLPSRSEVNLIISSAQMSFMGQKLNKQKTGSVGLTVNYSNLQPYFSVIKQKYHYSKAPEILNSEFNARKKTKNGMLKLYAYANTHTLGYDRSNINYPSARTYFHVANKNIFTTATYTGRLKANWQIFAGASFSYNRDTIERYTGSKDSAFERFYPVLTTHIYQGRVMFTKTFSALTKLNVGGEYQYIRDGVEAKDSIPHIVLNDRYAAVFAEAEIYYSAKLVSRVGVRVEHSSLISHSAISPRVSLAYKLNKKSQFSFAYGEFFQKPETNYLFRTQDLSFTRASHYILNFQRTANGQIFRTEVYYKPYRHLISYPSANTSAVENKGTGYAKGFEIFWRDKTTIKNLDYWVSYSFLDTKRKYLDYPYEVRPPFGAKHTASVVVKRFVTAISTQFSTTYSYASGRPYYNPNNDVKDFMADKTIDYHTAGFQVNYLRTFKTINAVFIFNISNVFGSKQIFGYRFTDEKINGVYNSEPITPQAKRFVFIGMYLSIGADRRKDILD